MKKFLIVLSFALLLIGVCATANAIPITFDFTGSGGNLGLTPMIPVGGVTFNVFGYRVDVNSSGTTKTQQNVHQNLNTGGLGVISSETGGNNISNDLYTGSSDTGFLELLVIQRPSPNYVFTSVRLTGLGPTEYATLKGSDLQDGSSATLLTSLSSVSGNQTGTATFDLAANDFDYLVVGTSYQQYWADRGPKPNTVSTFRVSQLTLEYTDPPPSAVPEPATMFLLGSGLIGIGAFVRRKFRK